MRTFAVAMLALCLVVSGCIWHRAAAVKRETVATAPVPKPPPKLTSNEEALAAAQGEVKRLEKLVEAEKLAPLRTCLMWAEVILGLVLLVEIGATVFLAYAHMPWRLVAGLCLATVCMLVAALTVQAALFHVGWVIAGACLAVAGLAFWLWKHHGWVKQQGKVAWNAVPDAISLHPDVEARLERLFK